MTIRVGIGGQRSNVEYLLHAFAGARGDIILIELPSRLGRTAWWRIPGRIWRDLDDIDLYYGIAYGQWLRYLLARVRRRGTICHWVGTDVLTFAQQPAWRRLAATAIDRHLAVSPNLAQELATTGITALVVPLTSPLHRGEVPPLPDVFTVLAYLPAGRDELYGADIIYTLAQRHPEWRVWIVGRGVSAAGRTLDNVTEFGTQTDMDALYPQTSVLVRPTRHDGLPRMVLEALSWGRYVVCSAPLPHCAHGQTLADVEVAVSHCAAHHVPNVAGADYVRAEYSDADLVATLTHHFEQVAGKRHA